MDLLVSQDSTWSTKVNNFSFFFFLCIQNIPKCKLQSALFPHSCLPGEVLILSTGMVMCIIIHYKTQYYNHTN